MRRWLNALVVLLVLSGCAGWFWEPLKFEGPLIEGNKRAKSFLSCDGRPMGISDSMYCLVAVEDHKGRKLQTGEDVSEVIDAYFASVPKLAKWAPDSRGNRRSGLERFPYHLYLLTISPIVVLAVPRMQGDAWEHCNGGRDGCIVSRAVQQNFFYRTPPPVRPGSFIFSPDLKITEREVSASEPKHSIFLGTSTLDLTANSAVWRVTRDAPKTN